MLYTCYYTHIVKRKQKKMNERTKAICTSIPYSYWKKAQFAEISWTDALKAGIEVLTGGGLEEEREIMQQLETKKGEISFLEKSLDKLKQKKKAEDEEKERKQRERVVKLGKPYSY